MTLPYKTFLAVLLISAFGSWVATPFVRRLALLLGAVDLPNPRKIHTQPMPRMGGLAVFLGFCLPWPAMYVLHNRVAITFLDYERLFLAMLLAGFGMVILGFYDDLKGANAWKKLLFQALTGTLLWSSSPLYRIEILTLPILGSVHLGWLSLPLTLLWVAGITNAINLLDGIDGLATGVTACIALAIGVVNILVGQLLVGLVTVALGGACLGFLPYNFSPARIFLGDTGSLFLGVMLSAISLVSLFKTTTVTLVLVPLIMFGLPIFDTLSVMVGRILRHAPVFSADKTHIHHRLLRLGWTQREAAFFLYGITLILATLAIDLSFRQSPATVLIGLLLLLGLTLLIRLSPGRRRPPGPPSP